MLNESEVVHMWNHRSAAALVPLEPPRSPILKLLILFIDLKENKCRIDLILGSRNADLRLFECFSCLPLCLSPFAFL